MKIFRERKLHETQLSDLFIHWLLLRSSDRLEIDTPMFSKIERGDRRAKREHVIKLAEYLHQDEKEMLTLWLADKILDVVGDDELSNDAITVAQEQILK